MSDDQDALIRRALGNRLESCRTREEKTRLLASILYYDLDLGFPSASVVRQYTQHGSLGDIQKDLKTYQSEIKDRERLHLSLPGMPESVSSAFTEAAKALWVQANQEADQRLDVFRESAQLSIQEAQSEAMEERRLRGVAESRANELSIELAAERNRSNEAEQIVAALRAELEALNTALSRAHVQLVEAEKSRAEAEVRFSSDLEAERDARKRDAEMLEGDIKFAKMQIHESREQNRLLQEQIRGLKADRDIEAEMWRQREGLHRREAQKLMDENRALREKFEKLVETRAKGRRPSVSSPGTSKLRRR